jgi:hypothetical protein
MQAESEKKMRAPGPWARPEQVAHKMSILPGWLEGALAGAGTPEVQISPIVVKQRVTRYHS